MNSTVLAKPFIAANCGAATSAYPALVPTLCWRCQVGAGWWSSGHVELMAGRTIYFVRFEGDDAGLAELGPSIGCQPEDLTQSAAGAKQQKSRDGAG